MSTLKDLIVAMLAIIPIGAAIRAVYCVNKMATDEDQASLYKRRLINLLIFVVIAECITGLLYVVLYYYIPIPHGGGGGKF